jgi:hypothetical protein
MGGCLLALGDAAPACDRVIPNLLALFRNADVALRIAIASVCSMLLGGRAPQLSIKRFATCLPMLGDVDGSHGRQLQGALENLAFSLAGRLPPARLAPFIESALSLACIEPTVEIDPQPRSSFQHLTGGVYVLRSDVARIAAGLGLLDQFVSAGGVEFEEFFPRIADAAFTWLRPEVQARGIVESALRAVMSVLIAAIHAGIGTTIAPRVASTLLDMLGWGGHTLDPMMLEWLSLFVTKCGGRPAFDFTPFIAIVERFVDQIDELIIERATETISRWTLFIKTALDVDPADVVPLLAGAVGEKCRSLCADPAGIGTAAQILASFFVANLPGADTFCDVLPTFLTGMRHERSGLLLRSLEKLFRTYELPPEAARGVVEFLAEWTEDGALRANFETLAAAAKTFARFAIRNEAAIDIDVFVRA